MKAYEIKEIIIVILIVLVFSVATPWNNLDGINPPKFFVIVCLGFASFLCSLPQILWSIRKRRPDVIQLVAFLSILLTFVSLFVSRYSLDERLFGIYGRSLGAVTYLMLFALLVAASTFDREKIKYVNFGLLLTCGIVALYFSIQLVDLDPASWQDAYDGVPSATLGNPNYVSSSLAILSTPLIAASIFSTRLSRLHRTSVSVAIMTVLYLIWETRSLQGVIIVLISSMLLLFLRWNEDNTHRFRRKPQVLLSTSIILTAAGTFFVAMGFASGIMGASLLARTDYWRAACRLILDNPLFGKGFDSFGDWYLYYRDQIAVDERPGLFSDSAHNLILELGVNGGVPLMMTYLFLQALALRSANRIFATSGNFHSKTLVVVWMGFHIQSAISPSSLALITLGFAITGIICAVGKGYYFSGVQDNFQPPVNKVKRRQKFAVKINVGLAISALGICSFLGAIPILKDARFRDAIENSDGRRMIEVSHQWPFNYQLGLLTAITLKSNQYDDLALLEVRRIIELNPLNIQGWRKLFEYSTLPADRILAKQKMKELDPLNLELDRLKP